MTTVFKNSSQKYPYKAFLVPNLSICIISHYFAVRQIQGCWFQIWQQFSKILCQKYPNKAFLVPIFCIFVFPWNFGITKSRGCWCQICKYCFQIPAQKYINQAFFIPNLDIVVFREILQIDKFEGVDFKSDNSFFKVLAQKFPNKPFLGKNTKIRHFCSQIYTFLFFHKISQLDKFKGADFRYDKKHFLNSNPKLPRDSIFVKKILK